jgi:hypothetical protein
MTFLKGIQGHKGNKGAKGEPGENTVAGVGKTFYISGSAKFQESMTSFVIQLDNITQTIKLSQKPNGHKLFPARSCCDLKHDYPHAKSGSYYIDPNGGSIGDEFQVMCDFEDDTCVTCIDPSEMLPVPMQRFDIGGLQFRHIVNLTGKPFLYNINPVQLKLLQISSLFAEQRVTIHCKALKLSASFSGYKKGTVFTSDKHSQNPKLINDGCSMALSERSSSTYDFKTNRPAQLPVVDVGLWLTGQQNEAVGIELGPVCYSR